MDTNYTLDLLKKLLSIDSPTGYTKEAIAFLNAEAIRLGYETSITNKGNLLVEIAGKNNEEALGVCAHVDTLGLMVKSIKANGRLSFTTIGGIQLNTLDGEYCRIITRDNKVYTGTILSNSSSSHVYKNAESLARNIDNMEVVIDEVVKNKDDVLKLGISNGDFIAVDTKTTICDSGYIKSRFLDDKLSVAGLFGLLKDLKETGDSPKHKTYFMVTTYEEVGHGNSYIPSDITSLLGVDMGCIGADLTCTELDVSICAKDSSGPYDYEMTSSLISLAKENNLSYAVDIYPMYGSDVSAALRGGNDIRGALIGPGVASSHGMERSHIDALISTMTLIKEYMLKGK